jgi:hypothetical protein
MEHGVYILADLTAEVRIAHVATHNFKALIMQIVEPPPVIEGVVIAQSPDIASLGEQTLYQM